MSEAGPSYLRCGHCRGFYDATLAHCTWCAYAAPLPDLVTGVPRVYADRAACRAVQVAEYRALPPEAHADCMRPPPDHLDLVCECIHCGSGGHRFEAVEMRWMDNEQMWACPCTTCGGRGFAFDVHPADLGWHCHACDHYFAPADGHYYTKNAVCPTCGSTEIDGRWDDDPDEDFEFDDDPDPNVRAGDRDFADDSLPWDDDELAFDDADDADPDDPYGLAAAMSWKESDSGDVPGGAGDGGAAYDDGDSFHFADPHDGRMPDDIDFPRPRSERREQSDDISDDDIPF